MTKIVYKSGTQGGKTGIQPTPYVVLKWVIQKVPLRRASEGQKLTVYG